MANGNTLRGEEGFTIGIHGYSNIDIDPKDSLGIVFQMVEEPK